MLLLADDVADAVGVADVLDIADADVVSAFVVDVVSALLLL